MTNLSSFPTPNSTKCSFQIWIRLVCE